MKAENEERIIKFSNKLPQPMREEFWQILEIKGQDVIDNCFKIPVNDQEILEEWTGDKKVDELVECYDCMEEFPADQVEYDAFENARCQFCQGKYESRKEDYIRENGYRDPAY